MRVFDSTGTEIGNATADSNGYPTLTTSPGNPLSQGTYYIGVSSAANNAYGITDGSNATGGQTSGDYTLTVQLQNPDPNGTIQGASTSI